MFIFGKLCIIIKLGLSRRGEKVKFRLPCPNILNRIALRKEQFMKHEDLAGKKFGRWTTIKYVGGSKWLCQCECGTKKQVRTSELKNGNSKSCGCLHKEVVAETGKNSRIYKREYKRLRQIFNSMKLRCYNNKSNRYKIYRKRGISICDEWLKNPLKFCEWAIENGYNDKLTIDRINNNGNYEPSNCRWITYQEQANNKRNNHYIEYNGIKHSMAEWSRILNINYGTLKSRIKYGWSLERIFNGT